MAITSNISIHLFDPVQALEIIAILMANGWTLNDHGKVSHLPLGDKDNYDWQIQKDLSYSELSEIIRDKESKDEPIGIIMAWQDTSIGGTVIIKKEGSISINLDINRKELILKNHFKITDFQWYLEKLLPPLEEAFGIEAFSFEQQR
jgi:hypothetical protein